MLPVMPTRASAARSRMSAAPRRADSFATCTRAAEALSRSDSASRSAPANARARRATTVSRHVAKLLRNIARRAHVSLPSGITFHMLRKTFVTHLIRDTGGDISTAQHMAGHSTPAVTMTYYVGCDAAHHASQISALQVASASATGHTPVTRKRRPMAVTQPTPVKSGDYASELPRRMPSDFIFL
ncbi:hypothetical protein DRW03_22460 [Corallococcus sp. H22C18031201]|nr:hypothetical protein DRW03_22460 [Corallococcus sp. H22C18031201]